MSNLRIVSNNAADRATLTADVTAGSYSVGYLQTDYKTEIYRSTGTSATITALWTTGELVRCVALPFTNFTENATLRVRGYTNAGDASPAFDTTAVDCCPYSSAAAFGWDIVTPGVANFAYGGAVYAALWFEGGTVKKLVIDIADAGNAAGYVEAGRLMAGDYYELSQNPNYGAQLGFADLSEHKRSDAGDLVTDNRTRSKTLSFSLEGMPEADRAAIMRLLRAGGLANPLYVSVFPDGSDYDLTQDYQIYGKLSQGSNVALQHFANYATSLTIDEI
jgi:hypothetical protein